MATRIKTAGELRGFLADVLTDLRQKRITTDEASAIAKVAGEITRSLAVEVHAAIQAGTKNPVPGSMVIADHDENEPQATPIATPKPAAAKVLPHNPNAHPDKIWCEQCDQKVAVSQAIACRSPHCKAKEAA